MTASATLDDNDWGSWSEEEGDDNDNDNDNEEEEEEEEVDKNDDEGEGDDDEYDEDDDGEEDNDDDEDGTEYRSPILRTQSSDAQINTGKRSGRTPALPSDPTNLNCNPGTGILHVIADAAEAAPNAMKKLCPEATIHRDMCAFHGGPKWITDKV
jgi:hypothetical protein